MLRLHLRQQLLNPVFLLDRGQAVFDVPAPISDLAWLTPLKLKNSIYKVAAEGSVDCR